MNKAGSILALVACFYFCGLLPVFAESKEKTTMELPKPTPEQRDWQNLELIAFAHFGINTFTDHEWGDGTEDPQFFNPTDFDARQWVKALKEAGFRLLILTAKHHDGFCLWPSKFTEHSVKNSPWRNGKGDVVREVADACRKEGLKFGVYLSPWDRHEPTYGDSPVYNEHFRNQLTELLSNYGPIAEVWFDGANGEGPNGKKQVYDWPSYYRVVRKLQPHALIAIEGPDIRWVGNESGVARENESSVVEREGKQVWYPAECDVSIRPGWFYHASEDSKVKSLAELADIYFKSVGRNSVLLLNVPPDRRGRIADADVTRLREFGTFVNQLNATNFITGDDVKARQVDELHSNPLEFDLGKPCTFNVARLQEDIALGECVQSYSLEAFDGSQWRTIATGTVIGHKQLFHFPAVTAQRVRLVINQVAAPTTISVGLYWNSSPISNQKAPSS